MQSPAPASGAQPGATAVRVARVVSAMEDPNPQVAGQGHAGLRSAGIEVMVGPGAAQARRDHRGHILKATVGRPCVTLKLAETADGFASGGPHDPRLRITGQIANSRVQIMRSTHEAIMIGVETALIDDPLLTVRLAGLDRKPWRVVLDTNLRLPLRSRLATSARTLPTLVIAGEDAPRDTAARLEDLGVSVECVGSDADGHVDLKEALRTLAARGVTRVFSEGGPRVAARLIGLGLADEVALITAEKPLGRPGLPALSKEARAALSDPDRYAQFERAQFGPDQQARQVCGAVLLSLEPEELRRTHFEEAEPGGARVGECGVEGLQEDRIVSLGTTARDQSMTQNAVLPQHREQFSCHVCLERDNGSRL